MVKFSVYLTNSPSQTKEMGQKLAQQILKIRNRKNAIVLGLKGDLGGGKTTFLKGFAKKLGVKEKILSPTFVIFKRFKVRDSRRFCHFDCYRIRKTKELLGLGFKKIISDPRNIVAIEWADRIRKIMPQNTIWLEFKFINRKKRGIRIRDPISRVF